MKIANLALLALMLTLPTIGSFSAKGRARGDRFGAAPSRERYNKLDHPGTDWGGHRVNAIKHIEAAQNELNLAEQYARAHHEMK